MKLEIRACPYCGNKHPKSNKRPKSEEIMNWIISGRDPAYIVTCGTCCAESNKMWETEEAAVRDWNIQSKKDGDRYRLTDCPHCGTEPIFTFWGGIECPKCHTRTWVHDTNEEAIEAWKAGDFD